MTGPQAAWLAPDRLHLQHGPIDLIIGADGPGRRMAFDAAHARFATVLEELVPELPRLRAPIGPSPNGQIAQRMVAACTPMTGFVTPMAAVAGAVADEVLSAMVAGADIDRAYVNNGGDIALYLTPAARFRIGLAGLDGAATGSVDIAFADPVRGIATSGFGGRSLTLGIAQSVTVLAQNAATADAAATLIANAVDLPGHPAISRQPAHEITPESDLGARLVTRFVGTLSDAEITEALDRGLTRAKDMLHHGLIAGAALCLRGQTRVAGSALALHSRALQTA